MKALTGVWSINYILEVVIQQELQNLIKILQKDFILKTQNIQQKLKTFTKLKKRNPSALIFLLIKLRKYIQSMY